MNKTPIYNSGISNYKYMKTYENDAMKERLSTIENNPEQNLLDNVTVSLTDIIDDEEEEDNDETEKNNN